MVDWLADLVSAGRRCCTCKLGALIAQKTVGSGGAGRGNRTANRVSVSSGKNDLKRLAGSGFRGFNILEDVRLSKCA